MAAEQSFMQEVTQASIKVANATVMAILDRNPHGNFGQTCKKCKQNKQPSTKTAHLWLEGSRQILDAVKLWERGKKSFSWSTVTKHMMPKIHMVSNWFEREDEVMIGIKNNWQHLKKSVKVPVTRY